MQQPQPADESRIDPQHESPRALLRTLGPIIIVVGALLMIFGAVRMFSPAWSGQRGFRHGESFEETSSRWHNEFNNEARTSFGGFGMVAGGMACLAVGVTMTKFGYMGRVARYVAAEIAPVGKDTFNYAAQGTKDSVRDLASAVGDGLRGNGGLRAAATAVTLVRCPKCNADNPADARFCCQCAAEQLKSRACPHCGELNDGDARFCDECGKKLAE